MKNNFLRSILHFILAATVFGGCCFVILYFLSIDLEKASVLGFGSGLFFAFLLTTASYILQSALLKNGPQDYIHSEPANHITGAESVGGRIYIFSNRLEFHAHPFNFNKESLVIPYDEIHSIDTEGLFGKVSLRLSHNITEAFIVSSKKEFVNKLMLNLK